VLKLIDPFNYADIVIFAVVLFCMLISMRRGMVVEVIAIGSLVAAVFVAVEYSEVAANRFIGERITDNTVRHYIAMGGLFVATMFAGSALNYSIEPDGDCQRRVVESVCVDRATRASGVVARRSNASSY